MIPPLLRRGTAAFLLAWLTPWRPIYSVRAGPSNLKFYLHYRDAIGRHIAKYGTHEPLLTRWLSNYLDAASPGLFIDIGANVGWHAVHAARHAHVEAVVAFEPDAFNAALLARNLAANDIGKARIEVTAVGAAVGQATLYRYKSSNCGRHSLVVDHGFGADTVPVTDLDSALARLGYDETPIAAIKIDVEGYEPGVIAGAGQTLERADAVILEFSPALGAQAGASIDEMLATFERLGFAPYALRSGGGIQPTDIAALRAFTSQLDIIWLKTRRAVPMVLRAMAEHTRAPLTLDEIAEQNKRIKTA